MELMPLGNSQAPAPEPVVPPNPITAVALADTSSFVAARTADALRQEEENRKGRATVIAYTSILAFAFLIGLIVIVRFAGETHEKNLKFQADRERAYEARKESERTIAAAEQANARQDADNQRARILDSQARADNEQRLRQQTSQRQRYVAPAPVPPPSYAASSVPQYDNPPPAPPVEAPIDTMQPIKEALEQKVTSEYGGYQNITYRETKSGFVGVVQFSDHEMASYVYRGQDWIEEMPKMNPALNVITG